MQPLNKAVYIMSCDGCLKIGTARDPYRRLRQTQVHTPYKVTLDAVWETPSQPASKVEALAHRMLSKFRVRGEWFRASMADVRKVESALYRYAHGDYAPEVDECDRPAVALLKRIALQERWPTIEEQMEILRLDALEPAQEDA